MIRAKRIAALGAVVAMGLLTGTGHAFASMPDDNVGITNVRDVGFTVYWNSRVNESGSVEYGTSCSSTTNTNSTDEGNGVSHWIDVVNLSPSTTYYFKIVSGSTVDDNGGSCYSTSTYATLGNPPNTPQAIYGTEDIDTGAQLYINGNYNAGAFPPAPGTYARATLVYNGIQSEPLSAITYSNGHWALDIANAYTADGTQSFTAAATGGATQLPAGVTIEMHWEDGNLDVREVNYTFDGSSAMPIRAGDTNADPPNWLTSLRKYLDNGGFESATSPSWVLDPAQSYETSVVHSGSEALKDQATSTSGPAHQSISVAPSTTYTVTAWVYQTVVDSAHSRGGAYLVVQNDDNNQTINSQFAPQTLNQWVPITFTFTTGARMRAVYIGLQHQVAGTYYWDDVSILQTSLINGGFEMTPRGILGWTRGDQGTISNTFAQTTNVHSGAQSLEVQSQSAGVYAEQYVALAPGNYTISACANPGAANTAYLSVWNFPGGATLTALNFNTASSYQCQSANFTVPSPPAGSTSQPFVEVNLAANSTGSPATTYWDDVSITSAS